jgi:outer membrane protein OmpA-like peptidoglycan-associated protein
LKLSQERADAVRNYLVSTGVSADQVVAAGFGKSRPIASNDTSEGRAQNRRVEFIFFLS